MRVSVGVCVYNEQDNIGKLLARLTKEPIDEIIVVCSGCTDNSISICQTFKGIKLIVQEKREGKASAVNQIIQNAIGDIVILESADTIPSSFAFKYLLRPLCENNNVGIVGAHPIPINPLNNIMNKIGNLVWQTHHIMALKYPKAGEVIAFRKVFKGIDVTTPVDEVYIEYELSKLGYRKVYAPEAVIFNKTPETTEDYIKQRKRIYYGHLAMQDIDYRVATMDTVEVVKATLKVTRNPLVILRGGLLEMKARKLAEKAFKNRTYNPTVWERVDTTKELK